MDGTVATSSPAATPTPSSPASSSTHSYSAADSACTDTALIMLRVVGIGNDVLAAPNPLPLGALGVGPWLQASSEAHGTLRWYRLQHANTGRVYHVLGVPDYRTTSPFTAVSYYAVADAAITFMPTRVSYMESSAEGARAAAGTSSNKRRGAMPFAVVGHADQTGPLLSELLRRSARSLQVAHVVVEHVDQAATERLAGAVEAALTTVVDALHTATGPHGAPDAQTAATAGRREGPFRAVILTRFPKAKVYLVSVQQGEVAVGDVVVCSSNANASCTRVNSMQCVTTRRAVQRAAAGSMVTLSVELFYSANPHALHSIFDVLCAADNTMSLPACLLAVRVLSTTPLIRAHLTERVLVQGTGGTSYGWVIGHGRGEEPSETILIVTSPYATVSLAAAGDVVGLCGKLPKHQRDEGADMLGSAIVLSCVHILSIHREILHAADMTKHGATAEAVTDLVQRFLSFFTASSYVPGFNLTKDAAFWLRFAVTRHTATEVSLELLKRLSSPPDADGSTQRWYGLTRDNAAHPCGLTLPVLITAMTRTKDAAKRVALLDELFKGCLLSAPLHIEENIRNSDREPTVLYDFAADDEHLVTVFAPEARYSYNVCPLPNELVSLHRLQEADIYPPPRRGFAANGWTVVQLERISACVENSSDACAKFLDALVSTGWLAPEDWHRVLTPPNIPRHPGACAALLMHPASHAVNLATAVVALFSSDVHPPWVSFYVALNRPAAERSGVDFGLQFLRRTRQAQHGSEGKLPLEVHWKHDFVCKSKSIYTAAWFRLLQRVLRGLLPLDLILSCVLPCLVPIQAFDA